MTEQEKRDQVLLVGELSTGFKLVGPFTSSELFDFTTTTLDEEIITMLIMTPEEYIASIDEIEED